jgi:RNA polymerase sigma factor (sigma-70 family)
MISISQILKYQGLQATLRSSESLDWPNNPFISRSCNFPGAPATNSSKNKMEKEFIEMINKHRGILFKVSNLYCHQEEDKKDLFQEMVLQLWRSYPGFKNDSQSSTWMYRVALNTAISNFRKESRKPGRRSILEADFEIPDFSDLPQQNENLTLLKLAINQLTQIEKAIIILYLEEKSYEEISEIIGISKSNVGVKINRIKVKLEKIIKASDHEYR